MTNVLELLKASITPYMLSLAVTAVRAAGEQMLANDDRRAYAVGYLIGRMHMSENVARLLVELAVFMCKRPEAVAVVDRDEKLHTDPPKDGARE